MSKKNLKNNNLTNKITVDYSNRVNFLNGANSNSGSFTAPRNGFAILNLFSTNEMEYIDVSVNGAWVAGASQNNINSVIVPLKSGDTLTWSDNNTGGYMRGTYNRSYFA